MRISYKQGICSVILIVALPLLRRHYTLAQLFDSTGEQEEFESRGGGAGSSMCCRASERKKLKKGIKRARSRAKSDVSGEQHERLETLLESRDEAALKAYEGSWYLREFCHEFRYGARLESLTVAICGVICGSLSPLLA